MKTADPSGEYEDIEYTHKDTQVKQENLQSSDDKVASGLSAVCSLNRYSTLLILPLLNSAISITATIYEYATSMRIFMYLHVQLMF